MATTWIKVGKVYFNEDDISCVEEKSAPGGDGESPHYSLFVHLRNGKTIEMGSPHGPALLNRLQGSPNRIVDLVADDPDPRVAVIGPDPFANPDGSSHRW